MNHLPGMQPPSFEPWYRRIEMIRLSFAVFSMLLVSGLSKSWGADWFQALASGIAGAVVSYFVAWALALWITSELYELEVKEAQQQLQQAERDRREQLERVHEKHRMRAQGIDPDSDDRGQPPGAYAA
jgi:hypothetical protein